MRRFFFVFICLGFLIFTPGKSTGAFELDLAGGVNFLTFHPDRITSHSQSVNYKEFLPYPMGFGNLSLKADISNSWAFGFNIERDNILFNSVDIRLLTRTDYFFFEFGPFAGMDDNLEIPDIGMIGSVEFAYPGIIFVVLKGTATLGSWLDFTSNNSREVAMVRIGFWLPNIIPSASFNLKQFTKKPDDILTLRDSLYRFLVSADFHSKKNTTIIRLEGGYEIFTRNYRRGNIENIDELSAFFGGLEVSWRLPSSWRFKLGAEIPFMCTAVEPMTVPDFRKMPKFTAGMSFKN